MKGTSKVIMGATLVMVVSLAVVLGLILVLLAELYCSLLLRRRRELRTTAAAVPAAVTTRTNASPSSHTSYSQQHSPPPPPPPPLPFTSIYAHGVLQAPRSFLFPAVSSKVDVAEAKRQLSELHQVIQMQTQTASSPPKPIQEGQEQDSLQGSSCPSSCGEHLVYISNPIYENEESKASGENTPFETPHTSPSHLERSGSSGEDEVAQVSPSITPPLTPMKKLPAEACSVPLRDARSLGTSGSESHSNNGLSSSSSGTPCTSPSW